MNYSAAGILILEDSPEICSLYEHYFRKMDLDCDVVVNGREAFQRITSSESLYSAFVVDLMMLEQDGISFIRNLKEIEPEASLPLAASYQRI